MRSLGWCLSCVGFGAVVAAGIGCGGAAQPVPREGAKAAAPQPAKLACEARHPGIGPKRYGTQREGSTVALAKLGDKTLAYVADEDSQALHTIDVGTHTQLARTKLAGSPAQVLVLADGRVAVSLRDQNEVQVLEGGGDAKDPLISLCTRSVPTEPIGLAATADDKEVLVASGWGRSLTALDSASFTPAFAVDLAREPRAIVVDDSGQRAFVSHAIGSKLSIVDLTQSPHEVRQIDLGVTRASPSSTPGTEKLRGGAQGYALAKSVTFSSTVPSGAVQGSGSQSSGSGGAERPSISGQAPHPVPAAPMGRIFAPMVTVEPGDPNVRSQAYYGDSRDGVPKEAPIVSVVDEGAERPMTHGVMSLGATMSRECLLPRAAATRASTGTLFVACQGIDSLLELDTRGSDPIRLEKRRWAMPAGPTGIAIDDEGGRAVVWSQFDAKVSILDVSGDRPHAPELVSVESDVSPAIAQVALGRQLFHTTDDLRIANDGVACASCHPDGRDDAFTWSTPEGPRQTIMLAGRVKNTEPYGWQGKHGDLKAYLGNTFSRLGGSGVTGPELDALMAYLNKLPGPPEEGPVGGPSEEAQQGRELFFDSELGCAGCHIGGPGVDKVVHDVGSKAIADTDVKFDTPSLKFVRGTAPYFHDGRYKTLEEVLNANDSEMGHTLQLTSHQRTALNAYLQSL